MNVLAKLEILAGAGRSRFFGFIQGHGALTSAEAAAVAALVEVEADAAVTRQWEHAFARTIGGGEAVSFAAGRMAFYATLRALGVRPGAEVLLTGFTCSVMPNAVWRTGATPCYADISEDTFGTNAEDVARKITGRTRAIVAQHTFGIPCDLEALAALARARGIPLIEDCALTLGSTLDGRVAGTWGDAAIFSTDHSKPLNTLIGGLLYTQDAALAAKVRAQQAAAPMLETAHRHRLWRRMLLERARFTPRHYARGRALAMLAGGPRKLRERLTGQEHALFLEADYKPRLKPEAYPYPARLPAFLAQLGCYELARWPAAAAHRRSVLARLITAAPPQLRSCFPKAYADARRGIIPLRLVYAHPAAAEIQRRARTSLDLDYIWFREPIVGATLGPASFGYRAGDCPVAERIGRDILNWPCDVPETDVPALIALFAKCHAGL